MSPSSLQCPAAPSKITDPLDIGDYQYLYAFKTEFVGDVKIGSPLECRLVARCLTLNIDESTIGGSWDLHYASGWIECFRCLVRGEIRLEGTEISGIVFADSVASGFVDARTLNADTVDISFSDFEAEVDFSGAEVGHFFPVGFKSKSTITVDWNIVGPWYSNQSSDWIERAGESAQYLPADMKANRGRLVSSEIGWWSDNFTKLRRKKDALEANYALATFNRSHFLKWTELQYWASLLSSAVNGFGARPFRPLQWSTFVIILFAVAFWFADPFKQSEANSAAKPKSRQPRFLFCLLYSLDTFLPLINITGVRDWGWETVDSWKWVFVAERLIGATLSAIAAYSVSAAV